MPVWELAKSNLKHNMRLSVAVAVVILFITPILFGTANLDRETSAVPLEMFVSLVGIALFVPVFGPEERREIDDLVSSKYVETGLVCLIRTVTAMVLAAGVVGGFVLYMGMRSCDVTAMLFAGTLADAVFLGGLGMMTSACTENTVLGYMVCLLYYGMNYGAGGKLGHFYLFSMRIAEYEPKAWLFCAGISLIFGALLVRRVKRRVR